MGSVVNKLYLEPNAQIETTQFRRDTMKTLNLIKAVTSMAVLLAGTTALSAPVLTLGGENPDFLDYRATVENPCASTDRSGIYRPICSGV